jgi:methylenetetrahydrofolate--tRNA-(uracil-5-)-methyltransferase
MDKAQYEQFVSALLEADTADPKAFEPDRLFEGCMPVESMARRGFDALRFGPLKPKGLPVPATGREAYAVGQLRQEDAECSMFNLVGFQTRLKHGEQRRVFRMIPGLESAEFCRYGAMHRNTYIYAPAALDARYACRAEFGARHGLYFAGQISGVEGYLESTSSGLIAGVNAARSIFGAAPLVLPPTTMTGALARYVSGGVGVSEFSPMNANFGLLEPCPDAPRNKRDRRLSIARRAVEAARTACLPPPSNA